MKKKFDPKKLTENQGHTNRFEKVLPCKIRTRFGTKICRVASCSIEFFQCLGQNLKFDARVNFPHIANKFEVCMGCTQKI
jgi:hypothetical protein